MKLTTSGTARLTENRSDNRNVVDLANSMRDALNGEAAYFRSLTTTDATPMVIWSDTTDPLSVVYMDVVLIGSSSAALNIAIRRRIVVVNQGIGVDAAVVANSAIAADVNPLGGAITANPAGLLGGISLSVTGAAATTVKWRIRINALWTPFE